MAEKGVEEQVLAMERLRTLITRIPSRKFCMILRWNSTEDLKIDLQKPGP